MQTFKLAIENENLSLLIYTVILHIVDIHLWTGNNFECNFRIWVNAISYYSEGGLQLTLFLLF
jgi:hypothetical protein